MNELLSNWWPLGKDCSARHRFLFISMIFTVIFDGISKAATVLSVLMKMYTIPHHDLNVVLVLQSSSDSLHILPGSSIDTCATSSDCAYDVGNMEVEEDLDMQEEEEEVNVKTEKGIGSEEEECLGIKDEEVVCSEEEVENVVIKEEEVEVIHIKEEEDVGIKEEVSLESTV